MIAAGCRACASLIAVFSELTPIAERLRSLITAVAGFDPLGNGRVASASCRLARRTRKGAASPTPRHYRFDEHLRPADMNSATRFSLSIYGNTTAEFR